jgi:endonuclease/exonuclease/phosphatase family metal-dependent hydrolase
VRKSTLLLMAVLGMSLPKTNAVAETPDVTLVSYNIRYGSARDGDNRWDRRRDFLVETIEALAPDLLGTQETLAFQRDFLAERLPRYGTFGAGRDDGKEAGEMMAVFWRTERFEKLDAGHFWLSERPDTPGSKSWDSSLPRMATWVKLRDKTAAKDAKPLLWINTHFDHIGRQARLEGARLVRERVIALGEGCSVIVTGDFNADEGSEPYRALFGERDGTASPVVDTFRVAHPEKRADEGTASGFRADATGGARIDWIACSRDWTVRKAGIDRTARDGRTPSDHFAVFAVLGR